MDAATRQRLAGLALNDNGFVFDPATGHTYTLNRSGAVVLRLCAEGGEPDAVVAALCERFDVDVDTARHDVADFLDRLAELGLTET